MLRIEFRQESREIAHLFMAVLEKALPRCIREEVSPSVRVGRELGRVDVSEPKATPHLAAIVRVATEGLMCLV
jgi:hypothetical protein